MNSRQTTLNRIYEIGIETPEQKKERRRMKVSRRYILSRHAESRVTGELVKKLDEIDGLGKFLSLYHTLGNFIPCPVGCNAPRGMRSVRDYWDLTLKIIYDYYINGVDATVGMIGTEKAKKYREWLDTFTGYDGQECWNCFVERNYMQDFVKNKDEKGNYGEPKELWDGHFAEFDKGNPLPQSRKQAEDYFENASDWITARSQKMYEALRDK